MPDYLAVGPEMLGQGSGVSVRIVEAGMDVKEGMEAIGRDLARAMLEEIVSAARSGKPATLIVPVGPVDQYPILARMINEQRVDCRDVCLINMDEYLTDDDQWIPATHPLSFRGYMQRLFYDRLRLELAPLPAHRVFPDPHEPADIQRLIEARGGVDACFGGIGINGHIAFNEPPEANEPITAEDFARLPTRCLTLTRETRTINSNTVGGEISIIPWRAITVGMAECLGAGKMRFYCNRQWQAAVVRRVLHGPITPACPASFLRTHRDASITVADYVAAIPNIQLR
jgi:glucosamine-6-phosphate deaminase